MPIPIVIFLIVFLILFITIFVSLIIKFSRNPYKYPYKKISIDVTGKRTPDIDDYIDKYLIAYGIDEIKKHEEFTKEKIEEYREDALNSHFKKQRLEQLESIIDNEHLFIFELTRFKTLYRQENYIKYPYKVKTCIDRKEVNASFLYDRYLQLENINFESTLKEYYSNDQRNKMTSQLREKIAIRDNFTCRICGKYMPDRVGLEIDHIIPISKGGKTVPSNLQVLCSRCNRSKSNKL